MATQISEFIEAMADRGLDPGDIKTDGIVHRFPTWGDKSGEASGAYWHNGNFGWFQDWRTMEKPEVVKGKLSEADKQALAGSFNGEGRKVSREALESGIRKIWNSGKEPDGHPYLVKKQIPTVPQIKMLDGHLIIPVFGIGGELNGLQRIDADGNKRFLAGTRKKGSFFSVSGSQDIYVVCEGIATGISMYDATGLSVAVAFDAGNLKPVAQAICKRVGSDRVIIAGDSDSWKTTEGQVDTGTKAAKKAASATGAMVVFPAFKNPDGKKTTDFNDLACLEGTEAVKAQIEAVINAGAADEAVEEREAIQAESKATTRKPIFEFVHNSIILANLKPIEWRIRDILADNSLYYDFGDPGSFKSFGAIDRLLCIAAGIDYHGYQVKQGTVFYIPGVSFRQACMNCVKKNDTIGYSTI